MFIQEKAKRMSELAGVEVAGDSGSSKGVSFA